MDSHVGNGTGQNHPSPLPCASCTLLLSNMQSSGGNGGRGKVGRKREERAGGEGKEERVGGGTWIFCFSSSSLRICLFTSSRFSLRSSIPARRRVTLRHHSNGRPVVHAWECAFRRGSHGPLSPPLHPRHGIITHTCGCIAVCSFPRAQPWNVCSPRRCPRPSPMARPHAPISPNHAHPRPLRGPHFSKPRTAQNTAGEQSQRDAAEAACNIMPGKIPGACSEGAPRGCKGRTASTEAGETPPPIVESLFSSSSPPAASTVSAPSDTQEAPCGRGRISHLTSSLL